MADLNFYFNKEDKTDFISKLYFEGFKIVPDLDYKISEYLILNNLKECLYFISNNRIKLFFIIHPKFSVNPLVLETMKKNDQTIYYIRQRYGGPSLSLFFTDFFRKNDTTFLGHGFLSYYPFYYSTTSEKIIVNEDLKNIFNIINKWVKINSIPYKLHSRTYYLGKDTIKQALSSNYSLRDINNEKLFEIKEKYKL